MLVLFTLATAAANAQQASFLVNYDVKLEIGQEHQQSNSVRLREGNMLPIIFTDYRLDLLVSRGETAGYSVEARLFERTDAKSITTPKSTYANVNPIAIDFEGQYQAPFELKTTIADIAVDLAIAFNLK